MNAPKPLRETTIIHTASTQEAERIIKAATKRFSYQMEIRSFDGPPNMRYMVVVLTTKALSMDSYDCIRFYMTGALDALRS